MRLFYAKVLDNDVYARYIEHKGNVIGSQNLCRPNSYLKVTHILNVKITLSPSVKSIGEDKWGKFYNFTGNEAIGHCFWCGKNSGYWRYCKGHNQLYRSNYSWNYARLQCKRDHRVNAKDSRIPIYYCGDCDYQGRYWDFAVHHIRPLMGHNRTWHWLNHQDNLAFLCHECHRKRHKELKVLWKENGVVDLSKGEQLDLF